MPGWGGCSPPCAPGAPPGVALWLSAAFPPRPPAPRPPFPSAFCHIMSLIRNCLVNRISHGNLESPPIHFVMLFIPLGNFLPALGVSGPPRELDSSSFLDSAGCCASAPRALPGISLCSFGLARLFPFRNNFHNRYNQPQILSVSLPISSSYFSSRTSTANSRDSLAS